MEREGGYVPEEFVSNTSGQEVENPRHNSVVDPVTALNWAFRLGLRENPETGRIE